MASKFIFRSLSISFTIKSDRGFEINFETFYRQLYCNVDETSWLLKNFKKSFHLVTSSSSMKPLLET